RERNVGPAVTQENDQDRTLGVLGKLSREGQPVGEGSTATGRQPSKSVLGLLHLPAWWEQNFCARPSDRDDRDLVSPALGICQQPQDNGLDRFHPPAGTH